MNYREYNFNITPKEPFSEILMAFLAEEGFDTFIDSENGFLTYYPEDSSFEMDQVIQNDIFEPAQILFQTHIVEDRNWNEEWEKNFDPIWVDEEIYIKADFHPEAQADYVIKIHPKMAFGTGHHETTYLMLSMMREMDFQDKNVLDMGAGTAILAIYAKMRGADHVEAIDIDSWAYDNALENARRNQVEIKVVKGDKNALGQSNYNIILANINKNILQEDIPIYLQNLEKNGILLLSGILDSDFEDIDTLCKANGLIFEYKKQKNEWISIKYKKK